MVRQTKLADVKVIEQVGRLVEVVVIPEHISTAIKMIGEVSLTETCADSQLHQVAVNVEEAPQGISYYI